MLADPEIQIILQDPMIQQILKILQRGHTANRAIMNPAIEEKIDKSIAHVILQTGYYNIFATARSHQPCEVLEGAKLDISMSIIFNICYN